MIISIPSSSIPTFKHSFRTHRLILLVIQFPCLLKCFLTQACRSGFTDLKVLSSYHYLDLNQASVHPITQAIKDSYGATLQAFLLFMC